MSSFSEHTQNESQECRCFLRAAYHTGREIHITRSQPACQVVWHFRLLLRSLRDVGRVEGHLACQGGGSGIRCCCCRQPLSILASIREEVEVHGGLLLERFCSSDPGSSPPFCGRSPLPHLRKPLVPCFFPASSFALFSFSLGSKSSNPPPPLLSALDVPRPGQAKPSQAKPSQAKPSQATRQKTVIQPHPRLPSFTPAAES